jgi:hypothetical protein
MGAPFEPRKQETKNWSGNILVSHESRSSEVSPQWEGVNLLRYERANFVT